MCAKIEFTFHVAFDLRCYSRNYIDEVNQVFGGGEKKKANSDPAWKSQNPVSPLIMFANLSQSAEIPMLNDPQLKLVVILGLRFVSVG